MVDGCLSCAMPPTSLSHQYLRHTITNICCMIWQVMVACESGSKYFEKNWNGILAKSLVDILLNGDAGNLKDALKAQALAILRH